MNTDTFKKLAQIILSIILGAICGDILSRPSILNFSDLLANNFPIVLIILFILVFIFVLIVCKDKAIKISFLVPYTIIWLLSYYIIFSFNYMPLTVS